MKKAWFEIIDQPGDWRLSGRKPGEIAIGLFPIAPYLVPDQDLAADDPAAILIIRDAADVDDPEPVHFIYEIAVGGPLAEGLEVATEAVAVLKDVWSLDEMAAILATVYETEMPEEVSLANDWPLASEAATLKAQQAQMGSA